MHRSKDQRRKVTGEYKGQGQASEMATDSEQNPTQWAQQTYYKGIDSNIQAHLAEYMSPNTSPLEPSIKKRRRGDNMDEYIFGAQRYGLILERLYNEMVLALKEDLISMVHQMNSNPRSNCRCQD